MNNSVYIRLSNGELYHYGVKGMKWGVRKDRASKEVTTTSSPRLRSKEQGKAIYATVKKGAKTTSQVMAKLGVAYVADQVLFDGVGTDAVKFAMKGIGKTAVATIDKIRK